ncbi:MAG: hypothetical protein HDT43_03335 [Ruminococcaceae bacterium]|nr:hypothetical protein [Oscillospiraceae bacterium]
MILFKSFYNIDLVNSKINMIPIPDDFDFFNEYIDFAMRNDSTKSFNIRNLNTTVVHCVSDIATLAISGDEESDECKEQIDEYAYSIADNLLIAELETQQGIEQMGARIKGGNLLQVLIENENNEYVYIIAKVDNSLWYDSNNLKKNYGFSGERKNVWKSAAFKLKYEDEIAFDDIRIYVDTDAKYWTSRFLDLMENRNDYSNTYSVLNEMDKLLKKTVKKRSERDYYILRNSLIQRLKCPHLVNYVDLVDELFNGYVPDEPSLNLDNVKHDFLELPKKNKFDTQFNADPTAVKKRRHSTFPVCFGIELRISDESTDFDQHIKSNEDSSGRRFLEVDCQDENTYKLFKERVEISV